MPSQMNLVDHFSREEIEQIVQTRQAFKEFIGNLAGHINNLLEYLQGVKRDKPLKLNYTQIMISPSFNDFKTTMLETRGTTLDKTKVEESISASYERMQASFDDTIDGVIENLKSKIEELKQMNAAKPTATTTGFSI